MDDLTNFFKMKKEEYEQEQSNWHEVRERWKKQIQEFLQEVKNWLQSSAQQGVVQLEDRVIELDEEHLGAYTVDGLDLIVGSSRIEIKPIGRLIIGALGRIDISSHKGSYITLYHEEQGWIYRNAGQREKFQVFNEASFTQIIKELA